MHKNIIFGHSGQDGQILSRQLLDRGEIVFGVSRRKLQITGIEEFSCDLNLERARVLQMIREIKPSRIFYLAASHVGSQQTPIDLMTSLQGVNFLTPAAIMNYLIEEQIQIPFVFASSSQVFESGTQQDAVSRSTENAYSLCKSFVGNLVNFFNKKNGSQFSNAILFNHESVYRTENFVTSFIAKQAVECMLGKRDKIQLNDAFALVDWSHAEDVCRALRLISENKLIGDIQVGSGILSTPKQFAHLCCDALNIKTCIQSEKKKADFLRLGKAADISKLDKIGWYPRYNLEDIAVELTTKYMRISENEVN